MLKLLRPSDTILKYLLAATILAVPLYPKFPFLRIPGTYVSIRLEDFLVFSLAIVLGLMVLPKIREIITGKIEKSIIIFLAIGLISLASAIFITKTVSLSLATLHWVRRIEYLVPFFAGMVIFKKRNPELLEFFLKLFSIVILIVFAYGYGQKHFSWPVIITQNEEYAKGIALRWIPGAHINSTFAGHYDLATFLVMLLPILVVALVLFRGVKTKLLLAGTLLAGLWLLSNAVSRISVVSYLMGASIALILVKKYKAMIMVLIVSLIFFSLSSDLIARYTRIIDVTQRRLQQFNKLLYLPSSRVYAAEETVATQKRVSRLTPTPTPVPVFEDRSTSIRLNVEWPRAIRAFSKNPLLGTGYSSITLASDNDYLRALGETGALGLAALLLIFARIGILIRNSLPLREKLTVGEKVFLAGIIGGLPGLFLNAFFIDIFEASKFAIIFWLSIGFAVSIMRSSKYEQNN